MKDLQRNPGLTQVLKDILASSVSKDTSEANAALDRCYKKGWLQEESLADEKGVYIFPSKLHERYAKVLLGSALPEFPQHRFPSVRQLCFEAISEFSPKLLSNSQPSLGAGAVPPPKEAQYKTRDEVPFLYFIVFSEEYTSYEIYDAQLNPFGGENSFIEQ